jgi:hypothetical protein
VQVSFSQTSGSHVRGTRGFVRFAAGSVEVHNDGLRLLRELLRAGDDVLLGVGIEIPLIKRTGVQRIEELR